MATNKPRTVTFTFAPAVSAKKVCLVGDFNGWKVGTDSMSPTKGGAYRLVKKLSPGRYEYKFYVDGLFWDDPQATEQVTNPYGTRNSVILIGPE